MNNYPFGSQKYFDIESGTTTTTTTKRTRKPKNTLFKMLKTFSNRFHHFFKLHPLLVILLLAFSFGVTLLVFLSYNTTETQFRNPSFTDPGSDDDYPFLRLRNLVMVAGHSIYTSSGCGKIEKEDSWFLESYQRNPGQAATFVSHIREGVEIVDRDDSALLLFSGGETRKDAGPRSEAQSYWAVAEYKGWFGKEENVKWRALTEEHAQL